MTLPVSCPPPSSKSTDQQPTVQQPQRKRRRRAPASGASDDCFTCTKRVVKCDRRRPYCSQCLEIGKECSGYKTQLTWGVGVASRGKLRGLSLPVARSAPAQRSPPPTATTTSASSRARANTTLTRDSKEVKIKLESASSSSASANNHHGNASVSAYTNYDFVNMAPHGTAPTMPLPDWNMGIANEFSVPDYHHEPMSHQRQLPQLQRLHTLSLARENMSLGLGPNSPVHEAMSAYAESEYAHSPISQSFPNDDIPYLNSPVPMYNYTPANSNPGQSPGVGSIGSMMVDARGPTSCPEPYYAQSEMSSSLSSHQTIFEVEETRRHQRSPTRHGSHADIFIGDDIFGQAGRQDMDVYSTSARSSHFGRSWASMRDDEVASDAEAAYQMNTESLSSSYTSDVSPRISFFMDFYDKVICPSVVVIDSPSNPYREHILSLATSSRSLQHAICALSACNLRMKRKQSLGQENWRRPSELEQLDQINNSTFSPSQRTAPQTSSSSSDGQGQDSSMQEECRHRSLAVQLLNEQLGDPAKARHDCVLATLFILCHYRMCESGIAQFRTQFAGVKKILGMRESGLETGNWGWMESLFTYFDGIAASINDRESQLRGGFLEMVANPANPNHALENLAGCDSVLFKTIARLGRLNLLAQHRPIMPDYPTTTLLLRPTPPMPRPKLAGQALVDFYNLHAHNFDGNGFASTLDDDAFPLGSTGRPNSPSSEELNTSFWSEWKACRSALQSWEFDPSRLVSQLQPTPSSTQLRDFGYISEAFRYSALLYTERLACPNLPSSHLNFQNLVSQVLYYVTSLEQGSGAEKFLLWPLFISGSECVNELQQSIVRTKCREIMGRSGYLNNLAGLEVLEKLWTEKDESSSSDRTGGAAFRWTKHMSGIDGEWIMV